jgi:hypothetical protein
MKCCNSLRNAETQHLMHKVQRVVIVVEVGVVKIYVAAVERQDETHFTTKIDGFQLFRVFHPLLNANNVPFLQVIFESHPVYDQTQGYGAAFVLLYR